MERHVLNKHYVLESGGVETRTAAFMKFFGRKRYYQKMGERLKDPALATRLELVDRRAKEASRLCPFESGNAFREFLAVAGASEELDERVRLLQQIVLQLRNARKEFQLYSFSVKNKLANGLSVISDSIEPFQHDLLKRYNAMVDCVPAVKMNLIPLVRTDSIVPNPDIDLIKCSDMRIHLSTGSPRVSISEWDGLVRHYRDFGIFEN